MAVTQNLYTGNGSATNYSFTFPYLETTDIKVSINGTLTTAYTLANPTTVQFTTAPANGAAIRIYRVTDDSALAATFYSGAAIRATDLNENFTQNLYVTQESSNNASTAITTANSATTTANTALSTANTASTNASAAVATANTASTNASNAVTTANTASTNASNAVTTANAASATANTASTNAATALSTANTASTNASNAVTTANTASTNASTALSTANTAASNASTALSQSNTALSQSSSAVTTANTANTNATAALNAVAAAVQYVLVANVAAIPVSPANGYAVEVIDSTGIESFSPVTNRPAGFVGDSGLSVRMQYSTTGPTWNWLGYYANNSESRYLKLSGGTLTGQLKADDSNSTGSPVYSFDGDTNTGIAHTGADELAFVTGGTARLTIDPTGAVAVTNGLSVGGVTAVVDTDARLSNTRTPTDGTVTDVKVSTSAAIAGTKISPDFGSQSVTTTGNVTVNAQGDLRFGDADSSNWVAFQGPATVSSNVTWTLPSADGTANQVLSTNGSGTLSWATAAAGGASVTTSDTAPSTPADGDLWYDSVGGRLYVYYQDPNGSQWVDAAPQGGGSPGKILQVVQAEYGTQSSTSSSTFADLGLSASITPASSSNKVLVFCSVPGLKTSNSSTGIKFQLLRSSTVIQGGGPYSNFWVASSGLTELSGGVSIMNKLDSPATTSSVTYKVQWATRTNGNTVSAILNDGGSDANKAVITLMEVAA